MKKVPDNNDHRQSADRRGFEERANSASQERRIRAERRYPKVEQIDFKEWAEVASDFHPIPTKPPCRN